MAHTICWFDLPVLDLERATNFYSHVLNAKLEIMSEMACAVFPHQDNDVGGCLYKDDDVKPSANGILVYFNVNGRLDAAILEVTKHGGQILKEKHAIGPYGIRAIILDSEGNRVALHSEP